MSLGQNDRSRGRQTNRGREPNPLTRSYDSHGPDVRIRGTAQHVAERYLQLARDAHTGNDPGGVDPLRRDRVGAKRGDPLIGDSESPPIAAPSARSVKFWVGYR
jgi:Domain of unknown function (DUF4167)